MKISTILFITAFLNTATLAAQTSAAEGSALQSTKTEFVKNGEYLNPFAKPATAAASFGDSLKGFDEKTIRQEIKNIGLSATEAAGYMRMMKRIYIDKKSTFYF